MIAAACFNNFHKSCKGIYPNPQGEEPCTCLCHGCCNVPKLAIHVKGCPIND